MHPHMMKKLFETSVEPNTYNFFLELLISRIYRLLIMFEIWLICVSLMIHVLLQKTNFGCECNQYGILFLKQTFQSVLLHATSYSSIYCSTSWLHQILISGTFFCFQIFVTYFYQYKWFVH